LLPVSPRLEMNLGRNKAKRKGSKQGRQTWRSLLGHPVNHPIGRKSLGGESKAELRRARSTCKILPSSRRRKARARVAIFVRRTGLCQRTAASEGMRKRMSESSAHKRMAMLTNIALSSSEETVVKKADGDAAKMTKIIEEIGTMIVSSQVRTNDEAETGAIVIEKELSMTKAGASTMAGIGGMIGILIGRHRLSMMRGRKRKVAVLRLGEAMMTSGSKNETMAAEESAQINVNGMIIPRPDMTTTVSATAEISSVAAKANTHTDLQDKRPQIVRTATPRMKRVRTAPR